MVVPSYPSHVHPFILWKVMEDRNVRRHEAVEAQRAVRDYIIDWELVLASRVSHEMMDLTKLKFKLAVYWWDEQNQGRCIG